MLLGNVLNPLLSLILVKKHHHCSSTRMTFAFNNPRKLICHLTKKQKTKTKTHGMWPNEVYFSLCSTHVFHLCCRAWIPLVKCHQQWISSSSCRATSTDIPDSLPPLLPVVHRFWQVLRATSRILTESVYVGSSWSSWFCLAIWGGP